MYVRDASVLRRRLKEVGLTQSELARRTKKSDGNPPSLTTINHAFTGRRLSVERGLAASIAAVLGVDVDELFTDTPPPRRRFKTFTSCPRCGYSQQLPA